MTGAVDRSTRKEGEWRSGVITDGEEDIEGGEEGIEEGVEEEMEEGESWEGKIVVGKEKSTWSWVIGEEEMVK